VPIDPGSPMKNHRGFFSVGAHVAAMCVMISVMFPVT